MIQDIIFALSIITINIASFLWLDVRNVLQLNKRLSVGVTIAGIVGASILLYFKSDQYQFTYTVSIALMALLAIRHVTHKLFDMPRQEEPKGSKVIRNIFDTVLIPFFVLFISFAQCMFLFVWRT